MTSRIPPPSPGEVAELVLRQPRAGESPGFQRMLWLCGGLLDEPWFRGLDALRVTGSKGKGSVATMAAALLDELGVECGLYTSPHLFRPEERARVGGTTIPSADLAAHVRSTALAAERYAGRHPADAATRFELLTAAALHWFARMRPAALVAEAGIGGRFDPVRVVPGRVVAMTGVELEHVDLLGPTPERIAYDKADLCPRGGTLVAGPLAGEVRRQLTAYCTVRGVRLVSAPDDYRLLAVEHRGGGLRLHVRGDGLELKELRLQAAGVHQAWNAIVALAAVTEWLRANGRDTPAERLEDAARRAFAALELPGRFELVHADPPVYVDVAHTPASAAALVETVRAALPDARFLLLTGVSRDKDGERMVPMLAPLAEHVVCTRAHHKGRDAEEVARLARPAARSTVEVREPIEEAVHLALRRAGERGLTVLVAGGLFLAVEAAAVLRRSDPRALWFA